MGNAQRKMDYLEQPQEQEQHQPYQQPTSNIMYMPMTANAFFKETRNIVRKEDLNRVEDNLKDQISKLDVKIDKVEEKLEAQIKAVSDNLHRVEEKLEAQIKVVKFDLEAQINKLDVKIDKVEEKLEAQIKELKGEIKSNFIWLMSVIVTIGGGLASLMFYIITKLPH